jgi:trimeric autotransporter adhesin
VSRATHDRLRDHFNIDGLYALAPISPAQLTGNQDNWAPSGLSTATWIRVSTNASRNLTGIVAPASGQPQSILISNVGSNNLVIKHDVTSTAANRFYCPASVDFTLGANASLIVFYDTTSTRWRLLT